MTDHAQSLQAIADGDAPAQLLIEQRDPLDLAIQTLAAQASHYLAILHRDLFAPGLLTPTFLAACKALVLRGPRCRIEILAQDNERLRRDGHRLIDLQQRLPSRVTIKLAHAEYREHPANLLIADDNWSLRWPHRDRPRATLYARDRLETRQAQEWFNEVWQASEIDSTLRRLQL